MLFWHLQLHPEGEENHYPIDRYIRILKRHKVIGFDIWGEVAGEKADKPFTEWTDEDIRKAIERAKEKGKGESTFGIIKAFRDRMEVGDIVLVRRGQTPVALVKVKSDYFMSNEKDEEGQPWFRHRRKVEVLSFFDEDKERLNLSFSRSPVGRGTLQPLVNSEGKTYKLIKEWLSKLEKADWRKKMKEQKERIKKLLQLFGQVILQGAPGTGKTFLAQEVAKELCWETECQKWISEKGNLGDELWKEFVEFADGEEFTTKTGSKFRVKKTETFSLKVYTLIGGTENDISITVTKESMLKILKKCNCSLYNTCRIESGESYNYGVAKGFKEWFINRIYTKYTSLVQFHPSYSYEDFVRGIYLEETLSFKPKNKIFAELCKKAEENKDKVYVLIIDEINRANLPAVLGELIYALEYRDREVETPYEIEGKRKLKVPPNLYIIGTMNTADRSIGHIDYAIRRRFVFIDVKPDKIAITHAGAKKLFEEFIEEKLFKKENLSVDFKSAIDDVKIGHSYFIAKEDEIKRLKELEELDDSSVEIEVLALKFVYQVIPLLREYERDGILIEGKLKEAVQEVFGKEIEDLTVEVVKEYLRRKALEESVPNEV